MTLTADEVVERLTLRGRPATREQVAVAFLDVDQAAITKASAKRIRWERWDKTSPINNVPAETIIASRDDFTGGEAYLMYVDDSLVVFQPTDPTDGSSLTDATVDAVAKQHAKEMAEEMASKDILDAVVEHLPAQQTPDVAGPAANPAIISPASQAVQAAIEAASPPAPTPFGLPPLVRDPLRG